MMYIDSKVLFFIIIVVFFVAACIMKILMEYDDDPFEGPHIIIQFDVSGRHKPNFDDYVEEWIIALPKHGIDIKQQVDEELEKWDKECEDYISNCMLWKKRKKGFYQEKRKEITQDDYKMFIFDFKRDQTRYRQSDYERHPYTVENTVFSLKLSLKELLERDDELVERATEYRNLIDVYNYYKTTFGRLGCDGNNGNIRLFYNAVAGRNAFHDINSFGENVIEMSTALKDDAGVMSHEYTHGIISRETGLGNSKIPGAINEAYADIMGELSVSNTDWVMIDRDMSTPKKYVDPNSITPNSDNDMGYVHSNSTIISNACYKMHSNGISKDRLA